MNSPVKRIAVIGPESSGKSELCSNLANHYKTKWVPEFARIYLKELEQPYTIDDIQHIYKIQFEQEKQLSATANKFIFTDTEFLIAKVWCEHAFANCPAYVNEMIVKHPYDLYLLTAPDLPWEYDPLRENPGKGDFFFDWYKRLLEEYNFKYAVVSGQGENRLSCAVQIIDENFPL